LINREDKCVIFSPISVVVCVFVCLIGHVLLNASECYYYIIYQNHRIIYRFQDNRIPGTISLTIS